MTFRSILTLTSLTLVLAGCTAQVTEEEQAHGHASMTMQDMTASLIGKTGDDFDKAFLEGMIEHHQGAIDMANEALKNAGHEEIKKMAEDIISAQQKEIDEMRGWWGAWGLQRGRSKRGQ